MKPAPTPQPAAHAHRAAPLRTLWQLLQPVLAVLLLLALVAGALGGSAVWLLRSEAGTQWLLPRLPGVTSSGVRGALLSAHFEADSLQVRWNGGKNAVDLQQLRGDGLQWSWRPSTRQWIGLDAESLAASRVQIRIAPNASGTPLSLPPSLDLPLHLRVRSLRVQTVQINDFAPLLDIAAAAQFGASGGSQHRVDKLVLRWDKLQVEADATIGSRPPFVLQLKGQVQAAATSPPAAPAWRASVAVNGPLQRLEGRATLRGAALSGKPAPSLDLHTTLTPFAGWPVAGLTLGTEALDLSTLASALPHTRISGTVEIRSSGLDSPVNASVRLVNALPGRWNEGLVPVRRAEATLQAQNARRDRLEIPSFDLQLGDRSSAAGRWQGSGEWVGDKLVLKTHLDALRPQVLDMRAAAMSVAGPVALTLQGLPSPDPSAPSSARQPWHIDLVGQLEGQLDAAPVPVQLSLQASADAHQIELREMRAQAGAAAAALTATARHNATGEWQLKSEGSLTDFDPLPWWPTLDNPAWRKGPHRLSGQWSVDLRVPALKAGTDFVALAQSVSGSGSLKIGNSVVAGVPLKVDLSLANRPAPGQPPSTLQGELQLGGNRLTVTGRGDPMGSGLADRLNVVLQAGQIDTLAPLARLMPALANWVPSGGAVDADIQVDGRWPTTRTEGRASVRALRLGDLAVEHAQLGWQLDTGSNQPLNLHVEGRKLALGGRQVDQLRADLKGTLRQHQLDLVAGLPLKPTPAAQHWLGLATAAGTQARLQGDGEWLPEPGGGGRWRGRVAQLAVAPWDGKTLGGEGPGRWAAASDLRADLLFDANGALATLQAAPGQLRLAEQVNLRWDAVQLDLRPAAPQLTLRADIEPFLVAPILARGQPTLGWGGDLRLAAKVELHLADKLDADIVFERRDGDLKLTDDTGTQPFGLSDLRVSLVAHDGNWYLTSAFAGQSIGEMAATVNLRPPASQRWPSADTPIDGVIELRVANIGIWGTWVPPGWRLAGAVKTSASVSGRLGEPDFAGQVVGNGIGVRNLLLGVDVRQGDIAVTLKGSRAHIDRFTLQGGEGTLVVSGSAELGSKPSAQLDLKAQHFRVLGRVDRQLIASGQAALALTPDEIKLTGKLSVDEGLFDLARNDAPALDDDVTIKRANAPKANAQAEPAARPRRSTLVSIDVDLGNKLAVRGRGLDAILGGSLHLGSRAGRLTVNGIVRASGTYAAYGQKLEIERGMVFFNGPADSPTLDVLALRPNLDTRVGVAISGGLQSPRVRLYAAADMSDTEKLSWLVLGRAPDGLGRTDTALLQRAAVALLAGEGEAPTDTLLRSLGIDELSVRQSDGEVRETVIALGKQLSRRWYVGYERGVNATTGTWQLIYRIAQRFTLRLQSGADNSFDAIWVWRVGESDPPLVPKSAPAASP